jgi:hypothetical protein
MKHVTALCRVVAFMLLLSSCQKQNSTNNTSPEQLHLIAIEMASANGIYHLSLDYDANGRIIKGSSSFNNSSPQTNFTVAYNNSEVLFAKPNFDIPGFFATDTLRFILNSNRLPTKRTENIFQESKAPQAIPQRSFIFDTTYYEYDAAGLLSKETHTVRDTTWKNNGSIITANQKTTAVTNYTTVNGNVTTVNKTTLTIATTYSNGTSSSGYGNQEVTRTFEYGTNYPNKTDFTNTLLLNEFNLFKTWPLNEGYKNLPEKITTVTVEKDATGAVKSTTTSTDVMVAAFDSKGWLSTITDPAYQNAITSFIYK